jgi:hypothetical protein
MPERASEPRLSADQRIERTMRERVLKESGERGQGTARLCGEADAKRAKLRLTRRPLDALLARC